MNAAELGDGLAALERLFDAALASVLANPSALTLGELVLDFQGKRDLVYALGLLNEGENEAALIAGLTRSTLARVPESDLAHLEREAWYYLRTSIDPAWQFDDGDPSLRAALTYLQIVVRERTAALRAAGTHPLVDTAPLAERATLLRRLRAASHPDADQDGTG